MRDITLFTYRIPDLKDNSRDAKNLEIKNWQQVICYQSDGKTIPTYKWDQNKSHKIQGYLKINIRLQKIKVRGFYETY